MFPTPRCISKTILCSFMLFLTFNQGVCLFEWIFGNQPAKSLEGDEPKEPLTRFEVLSTDEQFLDFAKTLTDLSPLDACYHIVVYELKKRCGELSEEELGKLSVQLLNCQSEVEQRPIFMCTDDMSLAECTKNMDTVTWNTYQIVGNRARAMCYATQQLQFRRLTEKSVNQLAAATVSQVQAMKDLKAGQEHLHSMAADTVRRLFESQQELLVTHEALRAGQADVFTSVSNNVKQLRQEKSLIATGNRYLAQLAKKIREELNLTAKLIKSQEEAQQEKHEVILHDLKLIHTQASEALARLDDSSERLLHLHDTLQKQQEEVFLNLQRINTTVMNVLASVVSLQTQMEHRISWITQLLGVADDKLGVLQCCLLHLAYFLLVVVVAAFLHTPALTRVLMMVVVVANMAGQLTHHSSLDFAGLSVFMASIIFVQETLGTETLSNGSVPQAPVTVIPSSSPSSPVCSPAAATQPGPAGDTAEVLLHVRQRLNAGFGESRRSPQSSRGSTPASRHSTPSLSSRCLGRTLAGGQCRLSAALGSDFCRRHLPDSE